MATEQPGVIDCSFDPPVYEQLPASVLGVARYLRGSGKALTLPEAQRIHATGRFIVLNDETDSGRALLGYSAGRADGAAAGAAARALGVTTACTLHPSIDFDVTSASQMSLVEQYIGGYRETSSYGQGGYGEYDVLNALGALELLTTGYGWQPSAWSGGRISFFAALWQYLNGQTLSGGTVDFNRLINLPGLGAWMPDGSSSVAVADDVWNEVIAVPMLGPAAQDTARDLLATNRGLLSNIETDLETASTVAASNQAAILAAIAQIQGGTGGLTAQQITDAVAAGVQAGLDGMDVTSTVITSFTKGTSA